MAQAGTGCLKLEVASLRDATPTLRMTRVQATCEFLVKNINDKEKTVGGLWI